MKSTCFVPVTLLCAVLAGCGGGGETPAPTPAPDLAQRQAAAGQVATTHADCAAIAPFHWSIGNASGALAEGRIGTNAPTAQTVMPIASASKLVYGAYVAELRAGQLTAADVSLLNFTSGYTEFDLCLANQTVAECQSYQGALIKNGSLVPAHVGKFTYSGGHMQKHAVDIGLGPDANAALAAHVAQGLGGVFSFTYAQPQLAGGVQTSAAEYGKLLQRIVGGQLRMRELLGLHAVCTNPATCPTAVSTPVPSTESWHYSIGHWVEDDPVVGDGAFSSAGAFGFYPWISADKQWWGVLARYDSAGSGEDSVACGRRIRAAWLSGVAR